MNHKYLQFKKLGLRAFEKCQIKTLNEGVRESENVAERRKREKGKRNEVRGTETRDERAEKEN